jgi:2-iminobutanoate/2-iminopropanoate deaminase
MGLPEFVCTAKTLGQIHHGRPDRWIRRPNRCARRLIRSGGPGRVKSTWSHNIAPDDSSVRRGPPYTSLMNTTIHSPSRGVYPATSDYVHALEVTGAQRMLFVAGTMGLNEKGIAGETLEQQLELVWSNIRTILASAGMTVDNIVRLTSYLRDAAYAEANAAARTRALGERRIPTTAIVVQTLDPAWLIELEVIATA